jgi:hypothetical protein
VNDTKISDVSGTKVTGDIVGKSSNVTGVVEANHGGTGLIAIGAPLQTLRVNSGGTALEYAGEMGDVAGPNSVTPNALARFDGASGKVIQASIVPVGVDEGGTGLNALGAPFQILRSNSAGSALEYASLIIGGGDVVGPAGSTDGVYVKMDGLTGKLLKNGLAIIPVIDGGTGLTAIGTSNQYLKVNNAGTALEYATLSILNNLKGMIGGEPFAAGIPIAKRASDGKTVAATAQGTDSQVLIGISFSACNADGDAFVAQLLGANISGCLTGLGFATGDEIYLAEGGGYTNDGSSFVGTNDSVIKLGRADCGSSVFSTVATDLILFPSVIFRPI